MPVAVPREKKKKEKNHSIKRIYEIIRIILNSHQKWITPIETVFRGVQGNLETSVYRKPTHTDKYLAFDSHHPICHKKSVAMMKGNRRLVVLLFLTYRVLRNHQENFE